MTATSLAGVLAGLAPVLPYVELLAGAPPDDAWVVVEHAVMNGRVGGWLDAVEADVTGGRRDVAAAFLGSWLTRPIAVPAVLAAVLDLGRIRLRPSGVAVRPNGGGWFDGAAFVDQRTGRADTERLAADLVGTVSPVFDAIRERTRSSKRAMWGRFADDTGAAVARACLIGGHDPRQVWRRLELVFDGLVANGAPLRRRPVLDLTGESVRSLNSECCLAYKVHVDPRAVEAYCATCPLLSRRSGSGVATRSSTRPLGSV